MRRVDYDDHQHRVFSRARAVLPENVRLWSGLFRDRIGDAATVVDVGAGVGHYSTVLAGALPSAQVVAVEPSERMREVAEREHAHPRVRYLAGRAEDLPLGEASCDGALFSNVMHHVENPAAAAAEVHRVLRPGSAVVVRGSLRDALRSNPHWSFFPQALEIAERQMPTVAEVVALFAVAGFDHVSSEVIEQPTAADLGAFAERISLRAISSLELLDDDLFDAGMRRLRAAAAAEPEPRPVMEKMDLVVLRRSAG
jgi:ubiquinone/menaquinone biosynthesis C-methylase UbiE